jgi:hypothetical protein
MLARAVLRSRPFLWALTVTPCTQHSSHCCHGRHHCHTPSEILVFPDLEILLREAA